MRCPRAIPTTPTWVPGRATWALALLLVASACGSGGPPPWNESGSHRWQELDVPRRGRPGFSLVPQRRTGIDFVNRVSDERRLQHPNSLIGSGVALGDADGDGRVDVYLSRLDGPNALYRNLGDWRFEDVAERAGVSAPNRYSTGAAFADVDGDRDLDLVVTALGGPNSVFINDGTGTFAERSIDVDSSSGRGSASIALADIEGDGDLDLYIANYKAASALDLFPPHERTFDRVVRQVDGEWEIAPRFRQHYRVKVIPEMDIVARIQRAEPDGLYLNDGTGRFEPLSWTSGRFLDEDGHPITAPPDYFALSARFQDVDADGDPDLYVCNDFEDPDLFWLNDGAGTFRAAPPLTLRTTSNAAMAVDFADIDRDGHVDFFEVDMLSRDPRRRYRQMPSHTALPKLVGRIDDRPQMQRNTMFVNRGDATFAEVAAYAGVEASDWSWATLFLDVDLDGYEDILVANGHVWDVQDADTDQRVLSGAPTGRIDWRRRILLYPDLHQSNAAFRNNGDLTFSDVSDEWLGMDADVSHSIATGDLDGDGDLDVVVNRLGSPAAVLRNSTTASRITIRLRGKSPNTHGVGATIRVTGGPAPVQYKEVTVGGLYLAGSDATYTFATGEADSLDIVVRWRSGTQTSIYGAKPNRLYEISETDGATATAPTATRQHFVDVSAAIGHRHAETMFDDFARQPLLPNELSRLGPGISWYDVDNDGDEDLLIPSGRGGALSYYRNDGGQFTGIEVLPAGEADQTTVLPIPGERGQTTLLVGQSSYEAPNPATALVIPGVVAVDVGRSNERRAARVVVPGDTSSTGPLALADIDADGDLDLFQGGRVIPTAYPLPASSRLFRNQGGVFQPDTENRAVLASVGPVSAATFSDIDGDGDADLLLAIEWGPIKLLANDGGRFSEGALGEGLRSLKSRWNGITTGDLDGDGRLDIVATSWGRNTKYRVDSMYPLFAYFGDFDHNGTVDVIEAQYDSIRQGIYPLAGFPRMRSAMRAIGRRIPTFTAYSESPIRTIIGRDIDPRFRLEVTTLEHVVLLNRGDRFEPRPLPMEAQFAPAFFAGVTDFDGDGNEDLFLSQNFFPTELETPRYDAGRALWLRGDGTGALEAVPGHISGITVYGDQRGAAFSDFNADGRVDVAVSQNGAQTKLYRNEGGRPGLRVRLVGPRGNPRALGATVRLVYPDRLGPLREIHAGTGYWSLNGSVQVLGAPSGATHVRVRWPDGSAREVPIAPNARELTIQQAIRR